MNENALKDLLADVLREGSRDTAASKVAYGRAFEERLPAMLRERDSAAHAEPSPRLVDAVVAQVLDASRTRKRESPLSSEASERRVRWSPFSANASLWRWGAAGIAVTAVVLIALLLSLRPGSKEVPVARPSPSPIPKAPEHSPIVPQELDPERPLRSLGPVVQSPTAPNPRENRPPLPSGASPSVPVGIFASVTGRPAVSGPLGGPTRLAARGMVLTLGSRIETGDADRAEIRFEDGTTVALDFNTILELPATSPVIVDHSTPSPSRLKVPIGRVWAKVTRRVEMMPFSVETPVATAEVLGTEFGLAVTRLPRGDIRVVLQVKEGKVALYNGHGRVVAPERTETSSTAEASPSQPRRLDVLRVFPFSRPRHVYAQRTTRLSISSAIHRLVLPKTLIGGVSTRLETGETVLAEVIPGSPAALAGLRAMDQILALEGLSNSSLPYTASGSIPKEISVRFLRDCTARTVSFMPTPWAHVPVSNDVAQGLFRATHLALRGDVDGSLILLQELADKRPSAAVFNNIGVVFELRDELGPAIRSYQDAVRLNPHAWLFRCNLGTALMQIGNFARAAEELAIAERLAPKSWFEGFAPARELARALMLMGGNEDALAVAERATERWPAYAAAWALKAEVLLVLKRPGDALVSAQRGIQAERYHLRAHWALAEAHHDLGQFDLAIPVLQDMVRLWPANSGLRSQLGIVLMDGRRYAQAETVLRKAIQLNPQNLETHLGLGVTLQRTGRFLEAEPIYRKVIGIEPENASAYTSLGGLLSDSGRLSDAEPLLRKAIALDPENPTAHLNLAITLHRMNRPEEAEPHYRIAIELDPRDALAHFNFAYFFNASRRLEEAEAMYRKTIELDPREFRALGNLGVMLSNMGRHTEAEPFLRKAVELEPRAAIAHLSLAINLHRLRKLSEAEQAYRRTIELDPKSALAHLNLGTLLAGRGQHLAAEPHLRKAFELNPREASPLLSLAFTLANLKRYAEAEQSYLRAIELFPKDARAYNNLGLLLLDTGREEESATQFLKAIEIEPKLVNSLTGALFLLAHQGEKLDQAIDAGKRLLQIQGRQADVLGLLGLAYFKQSDHPQAELHLTESLVGTNFGAKGAAIRYSKQGAAWVSELWWALGMIYEKTGRKDQAIEAQRRALFQNPSHEKAQEALKRIGGSFSRILLRGFFAVSY